MSWSRVSVLVVSLLFVAGSVAGVVVAAPSEGAVGASAQTNDPGPTGTALGSATPNGSASFVVADANVPAEVERGDSFETSAVIKNEGDVEGTATVQFVFDGSTVLKESLTLSPGEAVVLEQSVTADQKPGTYTFRVTAGNDAVALPVTVLDDTPPEARASGPTTVDEDVPVSFDGGKSSDNDEIASYEWSFGDGATRTGDEVSHTFARPGTYNVTLFVSDPAGNTDSDTMRVTVEDATRPTAKADGDRSVTENETARFDASESRDNGKITSYEWEFGDGETASGLRASHSYDSPGTYVVNLTVTDAGGNTANDSMTVSVADGTPPTAEAGKNVTVDEGTSVTFDGTGSSDNGEVANYSWTFGNGARATGAKPNASYADPGTYRVTLTVSDTGGNTDTDTLWVTVEDTTDPTAAAGDDRTVTEDASVQFDASESSDNGEIETYQWSFGDESGATGETVSHTYDHPGTYTVTLTVTDEAGLEDTDQVEVTVKDATAPTADAGADVVVDAGKGVDGGIGVEFDGSNSTDNDEIVAYQWTFGDGSSGTGEAVTHEYAAAGNYTAALTVVDDAGNEDTDTRVVRVERLSVSVSETSGGSTATVEDANAGMTISVPREESTGSLASAGNLTVTHVDVNAATDGDFDLTVTASGSAPESPGAMANEGVATAGYVQVEHPPDATDGGVVHFRVAKSFVSSVDGDPGGVALYRYQDGSWNRIAAERVDGTGSHYVYRAQTPGFSTFAVGVDVPVFSVSEASLSASNATNSTGERVVITRNQSVQVSATVANTGSTGGSETIALQVDGETVDSKEVTVKAGEKTSVTFTKTFEETGKHVVFVGGESTRHVSVKNASTAGAGGGGGGLPLIPILGGGVVVVLLVGGVGLLAYARLTGGGDEHQDGNRHGNRERDRGYGRQNR